MRAAWCLVVAVVAVAAALVVAVILSAGEMRTQIALVQDRIAAIREKRSRLAGRSGIGSGIEEGASRASARHSV